MRKFLLIGIIVTLLLAIPLTVYILTTQKTTTQSGATPSTVLSFNIPTDPAVVGTPIQIPVVIDPTGGSSTGNQVSFVKLVINYDGSKLQAATNYFTPDTKLQALEGPTNSCNGAKCTISTTLTTGSDPNAALSSQANLGVLTFNPLVPTDPSSPTQLVFDTSSQALSIASTDQPAENVLSLSSLRPGNLTITAANITPTDTGTNPTSTPTNTGGGGTTSGGSGTTTSGGSGTTTSTSPLTCNSLTADNTSSSSAPFTTLLTVTGGSTTSNITSVSFNYGDGDVENVTSGGGLGTNSISVQKSHIYKTTGTFTATAVLSDDASNTTSPSDCSITITVGADQTTPTPTVAAAPTAAPTIPSTGPGNVLVGVGFAGITIVAIGLAFAVFF